MERESRTPSRQTQGTSLTATGYMGGCSGGVNGTELPASPGLAVGFKGAGR
jgi:hypothetical protein